MLLTQPTDVLRAVAVVLIYSINLPMNQLRHWQVTRLNQDKMDDVFDFVVVGAGVGGSVIAARLTENPRVRVLLIEAGRRPENIMTDTYAFSPLDLKDIWPYKIDGRGVLFLNNVRGEANLPVGKIMGGSSTVNGMTYLRGSRQAYDAWSDEFGLTDWGYNKVLPYFKKSEMNLDPKYHSKYHGVDGPLKVSSSGNKYNPSLAYLSACRELGFDIIDLNGRRRVGCNIVQRSMDAKGVRMSASRAYLEPLIDRSRPNLVIKTGAFVTRILFDPSNKRRAIGVQFDYRGRRMTVGADVEVILSAGAVNTAKLLMLSGVGPADHLRQHQINVIADVPGVGQNFHDHVYTPLPNYGVEFDPLATATWPIMYIDTWLSEAVCQANSSMNLDVEYPDMHFLNFYIPLMDPTSLWALITYNLQPKAFFASFGPYILKPTYLTLTANLRPKSRGWVQLKSNDPYEHPIIQPNYLDHPDDVRVLTDALKLAYRIGRTRSFNSAGVKPFSTHVLGCEHHVDDEFERINGFPNDEYLSCAVHRFVSPGFHVCGSARMGIKGDPIAVVDERLKVRRVQRLRVVDASVIPKIPNANTAATVFMIAEKAADMIKQDYRFLFG